jgi:nicotinamide mononucleotide transporter
MIDAGLSWMRENPIEAVATVLGVVTVRLSAKENIWSWPVALVQVALSAIVCLRLRLLSDFALQWFYFATSVYGWYAWSRRKKGKTDELELRPHTTRLPLLLAIGAVTAVFAAVLGAISQFFFDAANPYLDATLSAFSVAAQWMMARKQIENWLVWIALDVVYVPLWFTKGAYGFALLYLIFLGLAIDGFITWRKAAA